jgi:hypothetical protein
LAQGLCYAAHGKAATDHANRDRVMSQWCPCIPQIEKAVDPTADHYEAQNSKFAIMGNNAKTYFLTRYNLETNAMQLLARCP